jgi:hypothetical protein
VAQYPHVAGGRTHTLYEISAGVRSTRNKDGGIVLDIKRGKIFHLNGVAASVFERLGLRRTRTQIVHEISQEFDISTEIVENDVTEFLESLQREGLVQGP